MVKNIYFYYAHFDTKDSHTHICTPTHTLHGTGTEEKVRGKSFKKNSKELTESRCTFHHMS